MAAAAGEVAAADALGAAQKVTGSSKRTQTPPPNRKAGADAAGEGTGANEGVRQRKPDAAKDGKASPGSEKAEASKAPRGLAQRAWSAYLGALSTQPVLTKAVTAAAISALGNIICQVLLEGEAIDPARMLKFALLNALYITPIIHVWHLVLNKFSLFTKPGLVGAMLRLLPDQLLFSPPFNYGLMILLFSSPGNLVIPGVDEWVDFLVSGYKVWPPAILLTFWLVPPDLHLLALNLVNLGWSVRVSALKVAAAAS